MNLDYIVTNVIQIHFVLINAGDVCIKLVLASFSFPKILPDLISYAKQHFYPSEGKRRRYIFEFYENLRRECA